jgi:quercetin dioxygenase-like cupin family protein
MLTIDLTTAHVEERRPGFRVGFPLTSQDGTAASALVYMELEPGAELPLHQDSAEELLLVLDGELEATVGDEQGTLAERELALVPAMVPHGLRNASGRTARVLGFFAGSTNIATFADFVTVIGAPFPIVVPLEQEAPVPA